MRHFPGEDDSKGLREVNSTWALFIILQVSTVDRSKDVPMCLGARRWALRST